MPSSGALLVRLRLRSFFQIAENEENFVELVVALVVALIVLGIRLLLCLMNRTPSSWRQWREGLQTPSVLDSNKPPITGR